jgi:hypothetical protein
LKFSLHDRPRVRYPPRTGASRYTRATTGDGTEHSTETETGRCARAASPRRIRPVGVASHVSRPHGVDADATFTSHDRHRAPPHDVTSDRHGHARATPRDATRHDIPPRHWPDTGMARRIRCAHHLGGTRSHPAHAQRGHRHRMSHERGPAASRRPIRSRSYSRRDERREHLRKEGRGQGRRLDRTGNGHRVAVSGTKTATCACTCEQQCSTAHVVDR